MKYLKVEIKKEEQMGHYPFIYGKLIPSWCMVNKKVIHINLNSDDIRFCQGPPYGAPSQAKEDMVPPNKAWMVFWRKEPENINQISIGCVVSYDDSLSKRN